MVVFHPGYSRLSYGSAVDVWVSNTVAFWLQQLPRIRQAGCKVALENIFEEEPSTLVQVLNQLDPAVFGHCFDSGHFNMFCTVSLGKWFAALAAVLLRVTCTIIMAPLMNICRLVKEIDFQKITDLLKQYAPQAVWTLEAHSRERLERSF